MSDEWRTMHSGLLRDDTVYEFEYFQSDVIY